DEYLDFARAETLRALNPIVTKAVAAGKQIRFTTEAGSRYFLKNVATEDLLKLQRTAPVYMELLFRKGVRDEYRKEALTALAKLQKKTELAVLLDAVKSQDEAASLQDDSVVFDLIRLLTDRNAKDLGAVRGD